MTRAQMRADQRCPGCGETNPAHCHCGDIDDEDDDPGPHTCVFVAVDDRDECQICGRDSDQFRDLHDSDLERAQRRRFAR